MNGQSIEVVIIGQDWCANMWEIIEINDKWMKKQIVSVMKNILNHLNLFNYVYKNYYPGSSQQCNL